ncbi:MAG: hypothetical protein KF789_14555 [Bdellovibrionaceae bacterium]|nr:hypothetical protein [Pseudobdellovibrionaceae bacterium]
MSNVSGKMGLVVLASFLFSTVVEAAPFFIYEGYLTDSSGIAVGSPTAENVPFILRISGKNSVDASTCELYRETRTVSVKDGQFSIPVGSPAGATVALPSGVTFVHIFGSTNLNGLDSCLFEPEKSGAYRDLTIEIERGGSWITLGAIVLGESPRSTVAGTAEKLENYQAKNFFRVVDGTIPSTLGAWSSSNYAKLVELVSSAQVSSGVVSVTGTSSGFTGSLGGDVSGTQSNTKVTAIQGRAVGTATPTNGQALIWSTAQNRWQPEALPGQLPPTGTAGGDLSGSYPNPSLKSGAVTLDKLAAGSAANQVLQFNGTAWTSTSLRYTALVNQFQMSPWPVSECAANEALNWSSVSDSFVCRLVVVTLADSSVSDAKISGVSVEKVASASGKYFKYAPNGANCATGQVLKWNNSRWECGSDETGAGTESDPTVMPFAKNAPGGDFDVSSGKLSLMTVPIAKGGTGQTTATAALQALLPGQAGQGGRVLGTDGSAASWVNLPGGTVSSITAGSGLLGGTITGSGTLSVDVGNTAGKILQLNGVGQIPAVSGALLTDLKAEALSSGTIPSARMPALTGDVTSSAGSVSLSLTMTGVTAGTYRSVAVDNKGRVVSGTNPTNLSGYGITDAVSNAGSVPSFQSGPNTAKPTAGSVGRIYISTDTAEIYRDDGTSWVLIAAAGGGLTSVTSASSDISVANPMSAPVLTLNSGSGANQLLKLNSSAQIPAVSGILLTNLNASSLTTGTLPPTRLPAFAGDVTTAAGSNLSTVGKIQGRTIAATTPVAGQILKWNDVASQWEPSNDLMGSGTVTSVTAGTGLIGGSITTSGVISIASGGVGTAQLADSSVTDAKIETMNAGKLRLTCTTGFTAVYPNAGGGSPFCIKDAASVATASFMSASTTCGGAGYDLCSIRELMWACYRGHIPSGSNSFWGNVSDFSSAAVYNVTSCPSLGTVGTESTSYNKKYYCCIR